MRAWNTKFGGSIFAASFATIDTKRVLAFIACLGMFFWSTSSYAVVVGVDQFSASGTNAGGAFNFTDNFSDGLPPPCGPAPACTQSDFYSVNKGTLSESKGFVQLDSSNGASSHTAGGGPRLNQTVTVNGQESKLLQSGGAISMSGIFTLPPISGPLNNGYGIRFVDGTGPGTAQRVLELDVQWWTGNLANGGTKGPGLYIRYLTQDFTLGTVHTIGADLLSIPTLASGDLADEIYLSLTNSTAGNNMFTASYGYTTGGATPASGDLTSFTNLAQGFLYQDSSTAFVRPQFHAFETVTPIPASLPLFVSGLGLVGLLARRRSRNKAAAKSPA